MMGFVRHLPMLTVVFTLVCVVLCSVFDRKKARLTAFICQGVAVVSGILVLLYALDVGPTIYQMGHLTHVEGDSTVYYWFNNVIRFGVLEGVLAALFPLVMFFSLLGSLGKLEDDIAPGKENLYYVLTNLALVALLALVYADDVFTGYVFLEISTLASIGLIAVKDKGRTTVAAIRYMIFNLVGSGTFLIGIVLLYDLTGYFMFEKIQAVLSALFATGYGTFPAVCAIALITIGLGIKSGLFPFYFWMADTYGESTTASACIISGLISKGYLVLLMKFLLRGYGFSHTVTVDGQTLTYGVLEQTGILNIVFILGVFGMIFGSISALFEKRMNKMIAYSSAAQIGYIYLAFGLGEIGMPAAVFQIIAHTVTKPLLFVSARGLINVSDHRPQFKFLRGSARRNVPAGIGFFIGAMSMIGFPATAGFMVKYLFVETAVNSGVSVTKLLLTIAALVISTLLNTGYLIHTVITVYSHQTDETLLPVQPHVKNRPGMVTAIAAFALLIIILGLVPGIVSLLQTGLDTFGFIAV